MLGRAVSKFWFWNARAGVVEENLGKARGTAQAPNASRFIQGDHKFLQGSYGGPGLNLGSIITPMISMIIAVPKITKHLP